MKTSPAIRDQLPSISPGDLEVSIVIPCLDEAATVGAVVAAAREALERLALNGEIIVADNGSTDGSARVAEREGARVVSAAEPGYGSAVRAGCDAARGRFIITADADGAHDPSEIGSLLERLRAGDDLVVGTRLRGTILPGAMPWLHRYVGNPMHSWVMRRLFRTGVSDPHCGLRGFSQSAYQRMDLRMSRFELTFEMVIKAAKLGLRTSEVPVTQRPDGRDRRPHLRSFRDGWRMTKFMLMFSPAALFLVPGIGLLVIGITLMGSQLFAPRDAALIVLGFPLDFHWAILGSALSVVGYQIVTVHFFARVYSVTHRLREEDDKVLRRALGILTLDRVLVIAGLVVVVGLAIDGFVFVRWLRPGLQTIHTRLFILGSTLIALGMQTFFNAFFFSILAGAYQADRAVPRPSRIRS